MKRVFETAEELRAAIPVGKKFLVKRTDLRVWKDGQYVQMEDPHSRTALLEEDGTVFIFNPRGRRYGLRTSDEWFISSRYMVEYTPDVDAAKLWERRVRNVIKKLDASGLWPDIKRDFEIMLEIGYENRRKLQLLNSNECDALLIESRAYINNQHDEQAIENYRLALERYYGELEREVPQAFYRTERGFLHPRTDLLYEMSDAMTKSMYFGKGLNDLTKHEIAEAMAAKRRYTATARTSYDVSFEYDPERNKAWYSEEYRDCANGHYYLAIDANTALFYEND